MQRHVHGSLLVAAAWVGACDPTASFSKKTRPPTEATADPFAAVSKPEPEPEPPPKVPDGSIAVGTFNTRWAFDNIDPERRSKLGRTQGSQSDADWAWKRDKIAEVLVAQELDIVALQEVGGEREVIDIVYAVREKGGYEYSYAWQKTNDYFTGQHVAILSRFPTLNPRTYDSGPKHVVADVLLPTGREITVIAVHMGGGQYSKQQARRQKQARTIKRRANVEQEERPVVILGTVNSTTLSWEEEYVKRTPGILAGRNTRSVETDDCADSSDDGLAQRTTVEGEPLDRIFSCGLEMRRAEVAGEELIQREREDPRDAAWPEIPAEESPYRDVSDHFVVWAELAWPDAESAGSDSEGDDQG